MDDGFISVSTMLPEYLSQEPFLDIKRTEETVGPTKSYEDVPLVETPSYEPSTEAPSPGSIADVHVEVDQLTAPLFPATITNHSPFANLAFLQLLATNQPAPSALPECNFMTPKTENAPRVFSRLSDCVFRTCKAMHTLLPPEWISAWYVQGMGIVMNVSGRLIFKETYLH